MSPEAVISIDIGSTWTKGALFRLDEAAARIEPVARRQTPTTPADLAAGFRAIRAALEAAAATAGLPPAPPVHISSSAKGGLAIAAVGLVPELTLEMARLAALSAGGKVVRAFSFKLTPGDIGALEALRPDIILLAGGTDGGNEDYVLHNAGMLAAFRGAAAFIYAGNRAAAGAVHTRLAGHDLHVTENLLPEFDRPNPDPARAVIRDVFLTQIVKGKGLESVVREAGHAPKPTPRAMLELAEALHRHRPDFGPFCMLDPGGATTDVYSCHDDTTVISGVLRHGLPEPTVKRTVEGDLGLRISARTTDAAAGAFLHHARTAAGLPEGHWRAYLAKLDAEPGFVPDDPEQRAFDALLAQACTVEALARHSGRERAVYTPDGDRRLRRGKDLRAVPRVIGTGGYLSRQATPDPVAGVGTPRLDGRGDTVLWPEDFEYLVDADYLLPLLGNLAEPFPAGAAHAALAALRPAGRVRQGVIEPSAGTCNGGR